MNGLSPQATFKPSPNPRYPNMSGRGRGHRRNMSHNSSTSATSSSSNNAPNESSTSPNSSAAGVAAATAAAAAAAAAQQPAGVNGKSLVGSNGSSFTGVKGVAGGAGSGAAQSTIGSHVSSGSSRDKEALNSTSQHQVQKSTSEGVSAAVGAAGGYPNEDRRPHDPNTDRPMGKSIYHSL